MTTPPLTIEALLERVARDGVRRTAQALRKPPLPSRLLQELAERTDVPAARQFVAAYPLAPSHLLETLAQAAPDPVVLGLLATNPRMPPHWLSTFAAHADARVRGQAALHPQIPPRELIALAADPDREVRLELATNPALRLPHQALLAADAEPAVRARLAGHNTLTKQVALALAADASALVRLHTVAVARVEEDVLLGWAAGDEEEIQLALARREDLPAAVERELFLSPHAAVRRAVRERGKRDEVELLFLARHGEVEERVWVAERELLARPLQNLLAQDQAVEVREALARNLSLDEEIARYFVGQAEAVVCAALAVNPVVPLDLVQELAATRHPEVLAALAYREVLEGELVQFLLGHSAEFRGHWAIQQRPTGELMPEVAKTLLADPLPAVRALGVAGGPEVRPADLWDYGREAAAVVRIAAIRHPRAPDELIVERLADPAPEVAAVAAAVQEARARAAAAAAAALRAQAASPAARATVGSAARPVVPPGGARPVPKFIARPAPGIFDKLKRVFWQ
jgi:hypothetical protein